MVVFLDLSKIDLRLQFYQQQFNVELTYMQHFYISWSCAIYYILSIISTKIVLFSANIFFFFLRYLRWSQPIRHIFYVGLWLVNPKSLSMIRNFGGNSQSMECTILLLSKYLKSKVMVNIWGNSHCWTPNRKILIFSSVCGKIMRVEKL